MKSLEDSILDAMDGSDKELLPFLPYILQDLWEIGAEPDTIIKLIRKHFDNYTRLKVLDLGCGKGAVSVKLSYSLGCTCYGIDAIPEFIEYARSKASEYNVEYLCTFQTGDIREKVADLTGYDLIILGAIGPVFGDYYSTLTTLRKCINDDGIFIIDDSYLDDNTNYQHTVMFKKSILLKQIELAGMQLVDFDNMESSDIKDSNDIIFDQIKKRCHELIYTHPDKEKLFLDYIKKQVEENDVLENVAVGATMVIRRKTED